MGSSWVVVGPLGVAILARLGQGWINPGYAVNAARVFVPYDRRCATDAALAPGNMRSGGNRIAVVALFARWQIVLAANQEPYVLGDVGGVVADALDVLGHEQQMGAAGDAARVLGHVGQQFAEQQIGRAHD